MPTPSDTQRAALVRMAASEDGRIRRYQGGFWISGPVETTSGGSPTGVYTSVDIRTVRAMEARGWVERTNQWPQEWRDERVITAAGRAATT